MQLVSEVRGENAKRCILLRIYSVITFLLHDLSVSTGTDETILKTEKD